MKKILICMVILVTAIAFTVAIAGPGYSGDKGEKRGGGEKVHQFSAEKFFEKYDKNGDEKISREEFMGTDEKFAVLDVNGDGYITPEEMTKVKEKMTRNKESLSEQKQHKNKDGARPVKKDGSKIKGK